MKRVLQIVTSMNRGGLESMIMNYYRNIDREKIQFDFLVHRDAGAFEDEIRALGGNIYQVPRLNPFSISYYRVLYSFFKTHRYDVVHSHLDCMSVYPLLVAKVCGVKKRIAHAHSTSLEKNLRYFVKIISRKMISLAATDLLACGEAAGKWMFDGKPFVVLNNAIDVERFAYNEEVRRSVREELGVDKCIVIGHVGRFIQVKNHRFLIEVLEKCLKLNDRYRLMLVGTGRTMDEIRELTRKKGIEDYVMFLGSRSDVDRLYQAMDVFLFPSLFEGFPVAMLEAQAAGVPSVISDNISPECILSDSVKVLGLDEPIERWAACVMEQVAKGRVSEVRTRGAGIVRRAGYDVKENVAFLEKLYG